MRYGEAVIDRLVADLGENVNIAFMPYMYSMWDSMETVFDAAVERGLKVILMPVTYMTKGDGEWHDDSALFNEIGRKADFQNCVPNVFVIHNPYDYNNRVTTIDPHFYTDGLKASGFKIVYLAYFGACYSERFILQPGVLNADYIFTGSEEERQRYIEVIRIVKGIDKSHNVFNIGGLPKYEAILKPREIPKCFDRINKFIVLICGSLTAFMNDPEDRIAKWLHAIDRYADMDECFVIFRPHPLMDDMINSMMRGVRPMYARFINEISQRVYIDKSASYDINFRYADYLISDPSSMVNVWKQTGKKYEVLE